LHPVSTGAKEAGAVTQRPFGSTLQPVLLQKAVRSVQARLRMFGEEGLETFAGSFLPAGPPLAQAPGLPRTVRVSRRTRRILRRREGLSMRAPWGRSFPGRHDREGDPPEKWTKTPYLMGHEREDA
jgi:hypothetical protein